MPIVFKALCKKNIQYKSRSIVQKIKNSENSEANYFLFGLITKKKSIFDGEKRASKGTKVENTKRVMGRSAW